MYQETWYWQEFGLVFWARGSAVLGLRQVWQGRADLPESEGAGLGVRKLGSECWPCAYVERQRREITPANSFVP